jgi:hypothetical protein
MQWSRKPNGPQRMSLERRMSPLPWCGMAAVLFAIAAATALFVSGAVAASNPPIVSTAGLSSLTPSSAVLDGFVNARAQPTNYVFQYGTTRAYGAQTPLASAGHGTAAIKVAQAIGGLQSHTTYHYRIVARARFPARERQVA